MSGSDTKKSATLDDVVLALQRNQEVLEDIAAWVKIGNTENVRKILINALKSPEEKNVYHLSDGRGTREINALCGVSRGSISKYQNSWYKLGLVRTVNVKGGERFIKKFNLEDFGIDIPVITPKKEQEGEALPAEQSGQIEQISLSGETV
jgi:hypothetical protein